MKLSDKYKIEAVDYMNVTVMEYKEPGVHPVTKIKAKEGKWVNVSFHPTIEKAYEWLVDKEINETGLSDIKSVVDKIQELKNYIKDEIGGM